MGTSKYPEVTDAILLIHCVTGYMSRLDFVLPTEAIPSYRYTRHGHQLARLAHLRGRYESISKLLTQYRDPGLYRIFCAVLMRAGVFKNND